MLAVSRLMLDNVPNIKAYWIMMGMPLAQVALHFGANDVQGTVVREEIFRAAGSTTGTEQKIDELVRVVRAAGRIPVQRDTLYNELRRWDAERWHRLGTPRHTRVTFAIASTASGREVGSRRSVQQVGAMLRLGRIAYVNMAPVFFRLDAEVEEVVGVPTELNAQAARRRDRRRADLLDRVRAQRRPAAPPAAPLRLLRGRGRLDPARLATPLERIRTVAVTPESATSVVLTKVLLPDAEHVPLGEDADATLLIGDAALKSAFEDPTPHHDLGRLWLERTGLPMVFAVWAAPEPAAPGLLELEDALVASVRAARAEPERLAHEARERYGYPAGFLARYFEKLRYRFGPARARRPLHVPRAGPRRRRARRGARAPLRHGARRRSDGDRDATGRPRSSTRRSTASGSPTPRRSRCSSRATSSRSAAPPTSCARRRTDPDRITFIVDRNLNYTNICVTDCDFCAFYRSPGDRARATCCRSR